MQLTREDCHVPYPTKALSEKLTKWGNEGWRKYHWKAYRTECKFSWPEAYQMTTNRESDIPPKLPTDMATEKSSKNAPKLSSKWHSPRSSPLRPYWMPNQARARSANAMQKRHFQSRSPLVTWWVWPTEMLISQSWIKDIPSTTMQWSSILLPTSGHCLCYIWITVTMPRAEAHSIIQCHDEIHVLIDYLTKVTLANSDDGRCLEPTWLNKSLTEIRVKHQWSPISIRTSKVHWDQANMVIYNQCDSEMIDGATNMPRGWYLCLYNKVLRSSSKSTGRQTSETSSKRSTDRSTKKSGHREVDQSHQVRTIRERTCEVDWTVTEVDLESWLLNRGECTSQCQLLLTDDCMIYSIEYVKALLRAQTVLARLNLVSITIVDKPLC